jgi:polyisoprenyl-teichoic acid--peptidoglycan teichoic acid transferase
MSRRRRRRGALRSWALTYAIALVIALATMTAALAAVNKTVDDKIAGIEKIPLDLTEADPGGPANYLLIGSDTREAEDGSDLAAGDPGGQRSDTIMVLHVDPQQETGVLVSFPRDLLVDLPGGGEAKINAAYNEGPQALIDTLTYNFPFEINHYVSVDFASFAGIVDAMGGITIDFPYVARNLTTTFAAGLYGPACYGLDGAQALNYVRQRSGVSDDDPGYEQYIDGQWEQDPVPDFGRIARQQDFLRTLATKAFERSRNDPLAANRISAEILSELQTDEGFDRGAVNALIGAFDSVDPSDPESLQMLRVPDAGFETRSDLGSVMLIDDAAAAPIFALLNGETTAPPPTDVPGTEESVTEVPGSTTVGSTPDVSTTTPPTTGPVSETGVPDGPTDPSTGRRLPDSTRC